MPIGQTFPLPQPQAIASFNFSDIDEGTGVIILFGYTSETSVGADEHLTTQSSIFSKEIETSVTTSVDSTFVKHIDLDFDLSPFNFPKTIEGTAFFQAGLGLQRTTGTLSGFIIVKVRKWDGSTETEIASVQSDTLDTGGSDRKRIMTVTFSIPRTHFKKGETLRITVEGWSKVVGGAATMTIAIGHDPRNRDGTVLVPSTDDPDTITQMIAHIPFRIEL